MTDANLFSRLFDDLKDPGKLAQLKTVEIATMKILERSTPSSRRPFHQSIARSHYTSWDHGRNVATRYYTR